MDETYKDASSIFLLLSDLLQTKLKGHWTAINMAHGDLKCFTLELLCTTYSMTVTLPAASHSLLRGKIKGAQNK